MIRTTMPFAVQDPPLIVHGCYHKSGTHWLTLILMRIGERFDLPFHSAADEPSPPKYGIYFDYHTLFDVESLPPFRGSHMVRDPRDMIVSGYFYHLWTEESWVHQREDQYGGLTYQQHLNQLSREDGLMEEIDRCTAMFQRMRSWDYRNPAFYEIKYEEMLADEDRVLRELFTSYGFHENAVEEAVHIGKQCGFRALTGRQPGQVEAKTITRSGKPGQWREVFTPLVKNEFKQAAGDLLLHLGYETDDQW